MSVYYPDACDDLVPDHICDNCEDIELGGIRSMFFLKTTRSILDPSNPLEWQEAFAAGDLIIIPETKGTFDGGAEVEAPGYGDQITRLTGYNFTLQFQDPNYRNNCAFYNAIKNSRAYKAGYRTETQIHLIETAVQLIPKNPVQEDKTTEVVWDVLVKWAAKNLPCPYDVPPGIFDGCVALS